MLNTYFMLDFNDLVLLLGINTLEIVLVSVMVALILRWFQDRRVETRLVSLENRTKGANSALARESRDARLAEVAVRAAELHKAGTQPMDIVKTCIVEYPDVAMQIPGYLKKMAKQFGMEEAL